MRSIFNFRFWIFDCLAIALAVGAVGASWRTAAPGWNFEFPRDHHVHREFKTEWWYFTGNLFDGDGRRFGYELTFFRHGIQPAAQRDPSASRFIVDDLKFAHFAITDVGGKQFRFEQKTSRGAFGEAGFDDGQRLAWIDNWSLIAKGNDIFELTALGAAGAIHLDLRPPKPPVVHGENGVSVKAAGGASASHYYSIPRLETTGSLSVNGNARSLRGESWFDHEWSSGQLGKGQVGWDWLCLQWDDGAELMLYRMRLENGQQDSSSRNVDRAGWNRDSSASVRFSDDAGRVLEKQGKRRAISDWLESFASRSARRVHDQSGAGGSGTEAWSDHLLGGRNRCERFTRWERR